MGEEQPKIAICCTCTSNEVNMEDWINHHLELGFDHIYLYNDGHAKTTKVAAEKHPDDVTVVDLEPEPGTEYTVKTYAHCYRENKDKYDWIAFIDQNDFIVLVEKDSIKDLFGENRELGKFEAVRLNVIDFSNFEDLANDMGIQLMEGYDFNSAKTNPPTTAKSIVNCKTKGILMGKYVPRRNGIAVSQCLPSGKPLVDSTENSNTSGVLIDVLDLDEMYITSSVIEVKWRKMKK